MGHLLCVLAFALFFLGDANDWRWGKAALRLCFPAGLALLAAALVRLCRGGRPLGAAVLCGLLGMLFLALLIHALFFASRRRRPTPGRMPDAPPAPGAFTPSAAIRGCCGWRASASAFGGASGCRFSL